MSTSREFKIYSFKDLAGHRESLEKRKESLEERFERWGPILEEMSEQRHCKRCGIQYTALENFAWKCRYHPGPTDKVNEIHRCCSQRVFGDNTVARLDGCKRCDHIDSIPDERDAEPTQRLPIALIREDIIRLEEKGLNVRKVDQSGDDPYIIVCRKEDPMYY